MKSKNESNTKINLYKDTINSIIEIKKSINEIIRDKIYIKNFDKRIYELLNELDDLKNKINVEIIQVNKLLI